MLDIPVVDDDPDASQVFASKPVMPRLVLARVTPQQRCQRSGGRDPALHIVRCARPCVR